MPASALARKTAEIANGDVGERETDGPNNSPRIRQYTATLGLFPPIPYCACAVCTWVRNAAQSLNVGYNLRFSASSLRLALLNASLHIEKEFLKPEDFPCILVYAHADKIHGHTCLGVGFDPATGKIQTIEANSDGHGSREGGGVYALDIRNINDERLLAILQIA